MILTIKVKISYSKNGFWSQQLVVMLAAQVGPYSFILLQCHKCVAYVISRWAEKVSLPKVSWHNTVQHKAWEAETQPPFCSGEKYKWVTEKQEEQDIILGEWKET